MNNFHPFEIVFFKKNNKELEGFTTDIDKVSEKMKSYNFTLSMKVLEEFQTYLPPLTKDIKLGDVFIDKLSKKLFIFCLYKGQGVASGIQGFGFMDLKTKKFRYFKDFVNNHIPKNKMYLIHVSNIYLFETKHKFIDALKENIDVLSLSLDSKMTLENDSYRSSILTGLTRALKYNIFKVQYSTEKEEVSFISNKVDLSTIINIIKNNYLWNIFLHIPMNKDNYKAKRNMIHNSPTLKTYTGSIFSYDLEEQKKQMNSTNKITINKKQFYSMIDKLKNENKKEFNLTRECLFYLNQDGTVNLKSLNISYDIVFDKGNYLFYFNSVVYKELNQKTSGLYLEYLLKLL